VLALAGDDRAEGFVKKLSLMEPMEADAITGILRYCQGRAGEARELIAES